MVQMMISLSIIMTEKSGDPRMDPDKNDSADTVVIHPDQAFILARKSITPLDLVFSGSATTNSTFGNFPEGLKRKLVSNPYGVDIMLSNLISSKNITTDENELDKWLAHSSQEIADNVKILSDECLEHLLE